LYENQPVRLDFLINLSDQTSTVTLLLGIKYSMRDLIS